MDELRADYLPVCPYALTYSLVNWIVFTPALPSSPPPKVQHGVVSSWLHAPIIEDAQRHEGFAKEQIPLRGIDMNFHTALSDYARRHKDTVASTEDSALHISKSPTARECVTRWWFALRNSLVALALVLIAFGGTLCFAQTEKSIPEEIEWTWEVRPLHPNPSLPSVLLLGDSISRNYYAEVKNGLIVVANVYLMASSICVGDPRLTKEIAEFARMEDVQFAVIHFNNGMHGWTYTEAEYKAGFPRFLHAVHEIAGKNTTLIWASTTPVRLDDPNGASNARIAKRNTIAGAFVSAEGIEIDDQNALMLKHQDLYEDHDKGLVHFDTKGSDIQGDQAAAMIRAALVRQQAK